MLDYALCRKNCRFSIGGESLCVAQNNYAVIWFKGKELNMVFGLQLSIARVVSIIQPLQELFFWIVEFVLLCQGSTVNFNIMKLIYKAIAKVVSPGYKVLGLSLMVGESQIENQGITVKFV